MQKQHIPHIADRMKSETLIQRQGLHVVLKNIRADAWRFVTYMPQNFFGKSFPTFVGQDVKIVQKNLICIALQPDPSDFFSCEISDAIFFGLRAARFFESNLCRFRVFFVFAFISLGKTGPKNFLQLVLVGQNEQQSHLFFETEKIFCF